MKPWWWLLTLGLPACILTALGIWQYNAVGSAISASGGVTLGQIAAVLWSVILFFGLIALVLIVGISVGITLSALVGGAERLVRFWHRLGKKEA